MISNRELHELMNDEKMYMHQPIQSGVSDCCDAPIYEDFEICSKCKDFCTNVEIQSE